MRLHAVALSHRLIFGLFWVFLKPNRKQLNSQCFPAMESNDFGWLIDRKPERAKIKHKSGSHKWYFGDTLHGFDVS